MMEWLFILIADSARPLGGRGPRCRVGMGNERALPGGPMPLDLLLSGWYRDPVGL